MSRPYRPEPETVGHLKGGDKDMADAFLTRVGWMLLFMPGAGV